MKKLLIEGIVSKILPYLLIISSVVGISSVSYAFYLEHIGLEIVKNWMRIEEMSIQQGNIFSSLAASNRILLSSGLLKSVMLFDVQGDQFSEMASFGEYMNSVEHRQMEPGEIKSSIVWPYSVIVFVNFQERPNLIAVFNVESPASTALFIVMVSLLILLVVGFGLYIRSNVRGEEAERIGLIRTTLDKIMTDEDPGPVLIQKLPHLQGHWDSIRSRFNELKNQLELSTKHKVIAQTSAMLAHDLRAPILSFERLLYLPDHELLFRHRESIRLSLFRLNSMIDAFRNTDLELFVKPLRSKLKIREQSREFSEMALLIGKRLLIEADENQIVNVDPMKFERAWGNLVLNAIDFAKTRIQFEVKASASDLILKVIDDGPGVQKEILPRLFQRGVTYGKPDGTGLGLAYVRQIMRGHGGDVTYRREDNLSVFECRLPNVVHIEKEIVVENAASISDQITQKLARSVAICLEPISLTQSILVELASFNSSDFIFTEDRNAANIIVSNIDTVMFEVHERDDQEYLAVAHLKCDEVAIMKILRRKFNLHVKGVDCV